MVVRKHVKKDVDAVISRGGGVASDSIKRKKQEWTKICLRITTDMIDQIGVTLENRMGITRTAWVLEAIQEKLKKDRVDG